MTQLKRIVISGYYGFSNAGDEAALSAIVRGLKLQADVDITVFSASPEETAKLHGVRALPRMSVSQVAGALKDCDLLISGGGSLIQDATSLRSLIYYLAVISLAKRYRRKVMILGQGIGPLRRSISRRLVRKALAGVDLITVRDAQSAELLAKMEIGPVRVTADPTFTLEPCSEEEVLHLLNETGLSDQDDVIAVSLRKLDYLPGIPDFSPDIMGLLADEARKLPAKLLLVGMQSPDDLVLAKEIGEKTGIAYQSRQWTPEQMLGALGKCRLVVGMRLHSLIFAASAGVPFLGIAYDPKVESFAAATGQLYMTVEEAFAGQLADNVTRIWGIRDQLVARLTTTVPAMRQAAEENTRLAAELISD